MKKFLLPATGLICSLLLTFHCFSQSIAVNNDGSGPEASAMLDVKSTIKGILIPRMGTAERQAIVAPAIGLLVFDNDAVSFWFFNGANWIELGGGGAAGSWSVNGADIYNTNAGKIGIGTNTPTEKLTILTGFNTNGWSHIGESAGLDPIVVGEGIGGVSAAIGTSSEHAFRLTAGTLGRVSLYPGGQMVVGPNATGAVGMLTVKTPNNADGISHLGANGNILKTTMGGTSAGIGTFSNTHMRIFCNSRSDIFIAEATGNVGIGTENFGTNKLEVKGNIRTKELVVETTNWPDYVFHKTYSLPLLHDVEKFITLNGHLPNIPSAKQVEEKGLHVGDTQKKMMEKIEELTLYVIQQQKEIDALKKAVSKNN